MVESDFGLCATCWAETAFLGQDVCDGCGRPVVFGGLETDIRCDRCLRDPPAWQSARSALLYRGAGRKIVLAFKHGDRSDIAIPAAKWLLHAAKPLIQRDTLVVPVPLHRRRYLRRRYNQSAILAQTLAALANLSYCPDALVRLRSPGSLEGLSGSERWEKLQNAIDPNKSRQSVLVGATVLLVDDVLTSGATLSAATKACVSANAKDVRVVTLARVAKDA